ncbi:MAG TPA: DNA repair protein RecO [Phycisphaerales bacterium]|nr:DNA repair protein RecO [Phycisphaerales bacterium]
MTKIKDTALALRGVNYSETSQVVTLLTREHGKIAAMAKGSRRPKSAFEGAIEPFAFGQVMFIPSPTDKLATLTELVRIPRFRLLHTHLRAMYAGLFALELTEAFCQEYDPHPALFDALVAALEHLEQGDQEVRVLSVLMDYQLTLLAEVGIAPVLDVCVNCGLAVTTTPKDLYFSSAANGLLCPGCEPSFADKRRLSAACAAVLNRSVPFDKAPTVAAEAERALIYHFTELLGRPPKMEKYVMEQNRT